MHSKRSSERLLRAIKSDQAWVLVDAAAVDKDDLPNHKNQIFLWNFVNGGMRFITEGIGFVEELIKSGAIQVQDLQSVDSTVLLPPYIDDFGRQIVCR